MTSITLAVVQIVIAVLVLLVLLLYRRRSTDDLLARLAELKSLSERIDRTVRDEIRAMRSEISESAQKARTETAGDSRSLREELMNTVNKFGGLVSEGIAASRQEQAQAANELRVQQGQTAERLAESVQTSFSRLANDLRETSRQTNDMVQQRLVDMTNKVTELASVSEKTQESLRSSVEERLEKLNESNSKKLEEMRQTVDEKLHATLEKRLTQSFGVVTEQLGHVQRGLGEMKDLANGVGDLKRVLTNIKTRGGYGEVQLAMVLDQMLSPDQYVKNANIGQHTVEFAIKLPGQAEGEPVLLPIDAKFPREAWDRLEDAQVRGDQQAITQAAGKLESVICAAAKDISEKYIAPPLTTNLAVMFLPTEGLYAEVVRRPGLVDELQTKYWVMVAGPTNFAALLTSLQMGFRTLAIQKKGSEVWKVLAATKLEFEKFGGLMDRVEKNIGTVQNTLREVGTRTRMISRTLKSVETDSLGPANASALLGLNETQEPGIEASSVDEPLLALTASTGEDQT